MDMNIIIGLASMAGCGFMFLVCAAQVWGILETAREMARSRETMAVARPRNNVRFSQNRRYAGASVPVFVPADGAALNF